MEVLHCPEFSVQENEFLCKDAYFSVPLHKELRKYISFIWLGNFYEFLYLRFGLVPASSILTKLLKIPIASLPIINTCLTIMYTF